MPPTHPGFCKLQRPGTEPYCSASPPEPLPTPLIASSNLLLHTSAPPEWDEDGPFLPPGSPHFCAPEAILSSLLGGLAPWLGLKGGRHPLPRPMKSPQLRDGHLDFLKALQAILMCSQGLESNLPLEKEKQNTIQYNTTE